ncbi:Palladin [Bagarius yarrelli]|uniref:Palladin n=1 Tax=Bagarius yarrelli TaxID=175774 RepID=A0A556U6N5_BAGYA|nr:Palladin [Bagarius yarrelli]
MQDGSWNETLPHSMLLKEACPSGGASQDGDRGVFLEASSDGKIYLADLEGGDGNFLELSAFLNQDEINRSLDLAREAMSDAGDPYDDSDMPLSASLPNELEPEPDSTAEENQPVQLQTKGTTPQNSIASSNQAETTPAKVTSSQSVQLNKPTQARTGPEPPAYHKPSVPVYKQDRPRLVHGGLEVNERAASTTEFCSRAATFIEELSSIFKGPSRFDHQEDDDSSSPDSGYLSPKSHKLAMQQSRSSSSSFFSSEVQQEGKKETGPEMDRNEHLVGEISVDGSMMPPRFTQKLRSQEVAEGSPITLECRVTGNPQPLVRPDPDCDPGSTQTLEPVQELNLPPDSGPGCLWGFRLHPGRHWGLRLRKV